MSTVQGVPFEEVVTQSMGLAFVVFPKGIAMMPFAPCFFGLLFFGCLFFGGLTSSMSMVEAFASGVIDRTKGDRLWTIL